MATPGDTEGSAAPGAFPPPSTGVEPVSQDPPSPAQVPEPALPSLPVDVPTMTAETVASEAPSPAAASTTVDGKGGSPKGKRERSILPRVLLLVLLGGAAIGGYFLYNDSGDDNADIGSTSPAVATDVEAGDSGAPSEPAPTGEPTEPAGSAGAPVVVGDAADGDADEAVPDVDGAPPTADATQEAPADAGTVAPPPPPTPLDSVTSAIVRYDGVDSDQNVVQIFESDRTTDSYVGFTGDSSGLSEITETRAEYTYRFDPQSGTTVRLRRSPESIAPEPDSLVLDGITPAELLPPSVAPFARLVEEDTITEAGTEFEIEVYVVDADAFIAADPQALLEWSTLLNKPTPDDAWMTVVGSDEPFVGEGGEELDQMVQFFAGQPDAFTVPPPTFGTEVEIGPTEILVGWMKAPGDDYVTIAHAASAIGNFRWNYQLIETNGTVGTGLLAP